MLWHALADEKPTEKGLYAIATHEDIGIGLYDLDGVLWALNNFNITHWLLITPPTEPVPPITINIECGKEK
jgi:hypothetical protein